MIHIIVSSFCWVREARKERSSLIRINIKNHLSSTHLRLSDHFTIASKIQVQSVIRRDAIYAMRWRLIVQKGLAAIFLVTGKPFETFDALGSRRKIGEMILFHI